MIYCVTGGAVEHDPTGLANMTRFFVSVQYALEVPKQTFPQPEFILYFPRANSSDMSLLHL